MPTAETQAQARIEVRNIGGIDSTTQQLNPGVTLLRGENATNRTSFLQAIIAAMGSNRASLKSNAEQGRVSMHLEGESFERTLSRTNGEVRFDGDPYLDDVKEADLFAFLLRENEARRAGVRGENLRDLVMRPIDTTEIERQISELQHHRQEIDDKLERIESCKQKLPRLERRREELREQISEKRAVLAEKEEEIEASEQAVEESKRQKEELETRLEELKDARSELESVRQRIDNQQASISSLQQERNQLRSELQDLPTEPTAEDESLDTRIKRLRNRRQSLTEEISTLKDIIEYNEALLQGDDGELQPVIDDYESANQSADDLTRQLVADNSNSVRCWTCGSMVEQEQINQTVERLRNQWQERTTELDEVKKELERLKSQKRETEQIASRREEVQNKIDDVESELERRNDQVDTLEQRRDELAAEVEELEQTVTEVEVDEFEETLALHKEANQIEFEIERLETEVTEVSEEINGLEDQIAKEDELKQKRTECEEEITALRTKVERIEEDVVEKFNTHMESVLDILAYDNLERVWIERINSSGSDHRSDRDDTEFELHVVRTTENGAAYEDTIEHLSESEREMIGLIFALAGYLVFDLHETVPFMLLDSLEAFDSDRISKLVDYFSEYAQYLVVALLEEDAEALDNAYDRVNAI